MLQSSVRLYKLVYVIYWLHSWFHTPLAARRLDRFEILVVEHKLGVGEARLALYRKFPYIMGDLGLPRCCRRHRGRSVL